jgi:hypothetical protein
MFVNRRTFYVKKGCMDAVIQLVKDERARFVDHPEYNKMKFFRASFGPFDQLIVDAEFEGMDGYQKFWGEYFASPEARQFFEKWDQMTEIGGTNELWEEV